MNIHKKLKSMSFSVCSSHKITDECREPYRMIPDDKASGEYRDSISQRKVFFNRIINFFKTN